MRRTVVVMVAALATSLAAAWPASGAPERAPESQQALADVNGATGSTTWPLARPRRTSAP